MFLTFAKVSTARVNRRCALVSRRGERRAGVEGVVRNPPFGQRDVQHPAQRGEFVVGSADGKLRVRALGLGVQVVRAVVAQVGVSDEPEPGPFLAVARLKTLVTRLFK